MLRSLMAFRCGLLLILLATTSAMAEHQESRTFRFVASRAMIPATDAEDFLSFTPVEGWSAPRDIFLRADEPIPTATHFEPIFQSGYSGLVWGNGQDTYCGQWAESLELTSSLLEDRNYEASSRVCGRSGLWAWHGFCHNLIEIRRQGDETNPGFWTELRLLDTIYLMTTDPTTGFTSIAIDGGAGTLVEDEVVVGGLQVSRWRFESENAQIRHLLWRTQLESQQVHWCYATVNLANNRTYLWHVIATERQSHRFLPGDRGDIETAHIDVANINEVQIRDLTEMGPWTRRNLSIEKPSELRKRKTLTIGNAVAICVTCVACLAVLRRAHFHSIRSLH